MQLQRWQKRQKRSKHHSEVLSEVKQCIGLPPGGPVHLFSSAWLAVFKRKHLLYLPLFTLFTPFIFRQRPYVTTQVI